MSRNMSIDELVAVNSLLIERETCLADVSRIEAAIADRLGQPYPFPPLPVALPSTQRGPRSKAAPKAKSAAKRPGRIRRLKPNELGYRITISENGVLATRDLPDFDSFQHLLVDPLPHHRILKIATIADDGELAETLFDSA